MKTRSRQSSHRHMCKEAMQIQLYEELVANTASRIWKSCKVGGVIFNKGLKWSIANGESVSAWADFWLPLVRSVSLSPSLIESFKKLKASLLQQILPMKTC